MILIDAASLYHLFIIKARSTPMHMRENIVYYDAATTSRQGRHRHAPLFLRLPACFHLALIISDAGFEPPQRP